MIKIKKKNNKVKVHCDDLGFCQLYGHSFVAERVNYSDYQTTTSNQVAVQPKLVNKKCTKCGQTSQIISNQ